MAISLEDLEEPVEIWKAIEGDPTELVALLRSGKTLGRWRREALADWLDGKLQPVRLPKGRPRARFYNPLALYYGHNPTTELGNAGFFYEHFRRFIRSKGWHVKKAGRFYWSAERLQNKVAERFNIDPETFINYLNRPRPKPAGAPWRGGEYIERRRLEIALEIHHAKKRLKG